MVGHAAGKALPALCRIHSIAGAFGIAVLVIHWLLPRPTPLNEVWPWPPNLQMHKLCPDVRKLGGRGSDAYSKDCRRL